ncbi:MAG: twin-arginine translocase TatA/TatE family subunit [Verrucomicrobiota bacterium]|jgi:sec-independent protein translocase protein TatA|nr:twin-arginine translocase TatA/TatE family subunit [Verrucomicrobiota bacterium]MEC8753644.1 twin-arginine translocase TatA/TatE family subunit [Verrucomicrobiota bacterium]|tara:strand:+ start:359 stop:592 length:234 start_codon:yes stop_codon:yes gene_type:complete
MKILGIAGLPGGMEVVLIIFVIILLFGARKLPELARSLGKSLSEFKKGQREGSITETNSKIIEEDNENTVDSDASDK